MAGVRTGGHLLAVEIVGGAGSCGGRVVFYGAGGPGRRNVGRYNLGRYPTASLWKLVRRRTGGRKGGVSSPPGGRSWQIGRGPS